MKFYNLVFILILPLSLIGQAQFVSFIEDESQLVLSKEENRIVLVFEVLDGYHIQADKVSNPNLIPTEINLKAPEGINLQSTMFSKSKTIMLGEEEEIQVFNATFSVAFEIDSNDSFSGSYPLEVVLDYQTCDGRKCYFPRMLSFEACLNSISSRK